MKESVFKNKRFRDVFSTKYALMILGGLILVFWTTYLFPGLDKRSSSFYLLLLAVLGFIEFYSFSRKVLIHEKSVTISYRPFTAARHNWNSIDRSIVWGYRFTVRFTMDNVKSVKLLSSSEAKAVSEERFSYLANGKDTVLIEFLQPLRVNMMYSIGSSKPFSMLACSVKDTKQLYQLLSEGHTI